MKYRDEGNKKLNARVNKTEAELKKLREHNQQRELKIKEQRNDLKDGINKCDNDKYS
jgi:hypothetical protein